MNAQLPQEKAIVRRWAAALILLLVVPLAISFNARLAAIRQMRQDEARLKQNVAAEEARRADLQLMLGYVTSDRYIEHWARVDARMAKSGEVPVIPIAPSNSQLSSTVSTRMNASVSIFDEWWAVFFDETISVP
jgi:cell division protein FtsB